MKKTQNYDYPTGADDPIYAADGHPHRPKNEDELSQPKPQHENHKEMNEKEPKNLHETPEESEEKNQDQPENAQTSDENVNPLDVAETPALSVEQLEEKLRMSEEQNLRLRAEFANYKKRVERDQVELAIMIKADILKSVLPMLDDLKAMLEKSENNGGEESVVEGARMIYQKFLQTLEREGVSRIDALGKEFNPNIHEAVMMKPTRNPEENGRVIEVFQDGFMINERLIRPTKVVVGNYQPESE